jgi:nitrite reductase/ring-hydroxylating ferredoxin subunit
VRHKLFPASELKLGEFRRVTVNGRFPVVVVRTPNDRLYALKDTCPHMGARLSDGWLKSRLVGDDVGAYRFTEGYVLRCPWHGYEFELETGKCVIDSKRARVRAYSVENKDGTLWLDQ